MDQTWYLFCREGEGDFQGSHNTYFYLFVKIVEENGKSYDKFLRNVSKFLSQSGNTI